MAIETSLPKIKKVRLPADAEKKTEVKKPTVKGTKPTAPKTEAKADKPAKDVKKVAKASTTTAKPAKAAKPAEAKTDKKPSKATASITADSVAASIVKKVGTDIVTDKPDYASGKSVADVLTSKAATILQKAYSDKAVATVTHADADIAKAIKELAAKNAATLRKSAVERHAKKMAASIVKAAKSADAGKLTATDFRAITFAV